MKVEWRGLQSGNVVRWYDRIWIVTDVRDIKGDVDLIPVDASNTSSHPSLTWPTKKVFHCVHEGHNRSTPCDFCYCETHGYECEVEETPDKSKTVETIEFLAENVKEYVLRQMRAIEEVELF